MKCLLAVWCAWVLLSQYATCAVTENLVRRVTERYGDFGKRAAEYLLGHMPEEDCRNLSDEFVMSHIGQSLRAREKFPWGKKVPDERFFNDVVPYAVFDEPRDPWREEFSDIAGQLVGKARTASEAARILNREFFDRIGTHYDTGRLRANQSPLESIRQGKATCTGLSIILVCACRSVGIPARAVGTPNWWNGSGNHTWVEIWDGNWHFMGADEHDPEGLDRGWFVEHASKADRSDPIHAIYATSWDRSGGIFPMVWSPRSTSVGGVEVTGRYSRIRKSAGLSIGVRLFDHGKRLATQGWLTKRSGFPLVEISTKAGRADLNDMARADVVPEQSYRWKFLVAGQWMETPEFIAEEGMKDVMDVEVGELSKAPDFTDRTMELTRDRSRRAVDHAYDEILENRRRGMELQMKAKVIERDGLAMPWMEKTFGAAPDGGRSLWISMHGGGQAPKDVNDQQWQNQIRLYEPAEGIYVAPRAPTDTWNLWHQDHIDPMLAILIEAMVALRGVDPDRVYLTGYSAGGDGVWQLAPRMADRFAAAAMMAGHPNEAKVDGLRNLPFAIFMGERDVAYDRAKVAAEKGVSLDQLAKNDPDGYVHMLRIYPGLGHWMMGKDAEAIPWMAGFERNPWPKKLVWYQDDVLHDRFYWLQLPEGSAREGMRITACVDGRVIRVDGDVPKGLRILLSDELVDLDGSLELVVRGGEPIQVKPRRSYQVILDSMQTRLDSMLAAVAMIECP